MRPIVVVPLILLACGVSSAQTASAPAAMKSRVYDVKQTVTLKDVPKDAKRVRLWLPIPGDAPSQKVLDLAVAEGVGTWRVEQQADYGNRFLYVEAEPNGKDSITVTTTFSIRRDPVAVEVDPAAAGKLTDVHRKEFAQYLDKNAPNMTVTPDIQKMADAACGGDDDVMSQVGKLWTLVADTADHYSKDPSKPKCGRGNAEDCLTQKGGCCTDLHSLFIALARARGIPTRIWFGYRLQAKNEGKDVDPGYRCWVEYFVPKFGWIPTDIVVGDSGDQAARAPWITSLDERRIVLCEGRDFDLTPKQDGPKVNTMTVGYAEIDGKPVPLLPDKDGKPSPLVRSVFFTERTGGKTTKSN
jgi:transglutaminase-like putative cysteine protease